MKHELIKTENYLLVVGNEKPTTEREWVYDTVYNTEFKDVRKATTLDTTKIIAHLPLNGADYLDGIDVLPDIEDEITKIIRKHSLENNGKIIYTDSFTLGYNKAKETYKYTEEDLKGYLDWHSKQGYVSHKSQDMDEYIQSLNQSKLPVAFECQIFRSIDIESLEKDWYKVGEQITFTNSEGRTEWVGTYKF